MIFWLAAALFFIVMQGFFSGMETGMVSVMRPRVEHAAKHLSGSSHKRMLFFLNHSGIMIATTLLGVNISVVLASLSFKNFIESLGFSGGLWIAAATGTLSLILLMSELISKNWFRQLPYARCSRCVFLLYGVWMLMKPVVIAFSAVTEFLDRKIAGKKPETEKGTMKKDFQLFVRESVGYGSIDSATASILHHVMTLPAVKLADIAVPADSVPGVSADATVREAFELAKQCGSDELPVRSLGTHEVVGIFDAYNAILKFDEADWENFPVSACMSGLHVLLETDDVSRAVDVARHDRVPLFVIADRFGRQTGLLSPDRIAELLFR